MVRVAAITLTVGLMVAGAAWSRTAESDTTATPRLDLSDTTVEVQLWPPKLRAYGLVWLPIGTVADRTGLGFGLETVLPYHILGDKESLTSELRVAVMGTTENQWWFNLDSDFYWNQNRNYAEFGLDYYGLAREFWGLGPATEDSAREIYIPHDFGSFAETTWRLWGRTLAVGPRLEYQHHAVSDLQEGGQLETGDVKGTAGGAIFGLGLALTWDRRDDRYRPSAGWYIRARLMRYRGSNTDDHRFFLSSLDWRSYRRLAEKHVIAGQVYLEGANDGTPFWRLPSLGGTAYSRAYPSDRWLDDSLVAGQAEWRWQALSHWGLVGFVGAAVVGDDLKSMQSRYLRPSVGLGIRYFAGRGDDSVPIRLDCAVGYQSWRLSFGISEAF